MELQSTRQTTANIILIPSEIRRQKMPREIISLGSLALWATPHESRIYFFSSFIPDQRYPGFTFSQTISYHFRLLFVTEIDIDS